MVTVTFRVEGIALKNQPAAGRPAIGRFSGRHSTICPFVDRLVSGCPITSTPATNCPSVSFPTVGRRNSWRRGRRGRRRIRNIALLVGPGRLGGVPRRRRETIQGRSGTRALQPSSEPQYCSALRVMRNWTDSFGIVSGGQ